MRIWHKELIGVLPTQQLIAQWRECTLIAKLIHINGSPNHILVNKVTEYSPDHMATYCYNVMWNMIHRGYSPSPTTKLAIENYIGVSLQPYIDIDLLFDDWHTNKYLWQCISNLEEKYDCGGISYEEWQIIDDFVTERL